MVDPGNVAVPKRAHGHGLALIGGGEARRYLARLQTVSDVRREMCRCYREARAGRLATADLARFVFALQLIAKVQDAADFDLRLRALEETLHGNRFTSGGASLGAML